MEPLDAGRGRHVTIGFSRLGRDTNPVALGRDQPNSRTDVTRDQAARRALGMNRRMPAKDSYKLFQDVVKTTISTASIVVDIRWETPPHP